MVLILRVKNMRYIPLAGSTGRLLNVRGVAIPRALFLRRFKFTYLSLLNRYLVPDFVNPLARHL